MSPEFSKGHLFNSNPTPPDSILCYWADSKPEDLWGDVDGEIGLYVGFDRYTANFPFIASPMQPILGGATPPYSNTGVPLFNTFDAPISDLETFYTGTDLIEINGEKVNVPSCDSSISRNSVHVDWLTFSFSESDVLATAPKFPYIHLKQSLPASDFAPLIISTLTTILGDLGFTRCDKGILGYTNKYNIGHKGVYGYIAYGGESQRGRATVAITGQGCSVIRDRIKLLYPYLQAISAVITRSDLALDCFAGEYTPLDARNDYQLGKFRRAKATNPGYNMIGNWLNDDDIGKTFYIGSRSSGRFCRTYDKGYEVLGKTMYEAALHVDHPLHRLIGWTRVECELKNKDLYIPLEVLLVPSSYFVGMYPAFAHLFDSPDPVPNPITKVKNKVKATMERSKAFIKKQLSGSLQCLEALGMLDSFIQECLAHSVGKPPAWFQTISDLSLAV